MNKTPVHNLTAAERELVSDILFDFIQTAEFFGDNLTDAEQSKRRRALIRIAFKLLRQRFEDPQRRAHPFWIKYQLQVHARSIYSEARQIMEESEYAAMCEEEDLIRHVRRDVLGL